MTLNEPQWQPMRFCSRCGAQLGERMVNGRVRPACPACGFVVYVNPKVACGALIAREGRVLLVRRRHEPGRGLWCLPCGFAEADEPPEAAVLREVLEETGLRARLNGLQGVYHYTDDPRGAGLLLAYRAHCDDFGALAAGDDADDIGWFAPDALPTISHHTHRSALEEWLAAGGADRE